MAKAGKAAKVWSIVSTVLVVLVVLIAVLLMGSRVVGYQVYNVISGSMEPTYSVGDLVYVKKMSAAEVAQIQVGDPITFVLNENLVVATHRVIAVDTENQLFYTKGDANETADKAPVRFQNVIGVPQFSLPYLGYVSDYVQHPPGMYVAIGVGILLVLAVFLPDFFVNSKKEDAAAAETDTPAEPTVDDTPPAPVGAEEASEEENTV